MTNNEKRELALNKIREFEYDYGSSLELNKMVKLFIDGFNEAQEQLKYSDSKIEIVQCIICKFKSECRFKNMNTDNKCKYFIKSDV